MRLRLSRNRAKPKQKRQNEKLSAVGGRPKRLPPAGLRLKSAACDIPGKKREEQ
jgi:hypothetical protein